ncbi:MAG: hypothetical protein J7493_17170 [Porphyrobacter sp.]|nr:hypothetical protein [Porphyrobacter sp.]
MTESKRDRTKVSLAWLAYWAIAHDDEEQAFVREYLDEAFTVLARLRRHDSLTEEDHQGLTDLTLVLAGLREALDPTGGGRILLSPEVRKSSEKGGRRRLSYDEIRRRREAGARAYRLAKSEDMTKTAAVESAWEEMRAAGRAEGLSARIIERAMDDHRHELEALNLSQ